MLLGNVGVGVNAVIINGEKMARDNISGVKSSGTISFIFLMPGKVLQWIMYMSVITRKVTERSVKQLG